MVYLIDGLIVLSVICVLWPMMMSRPATMPLSGAALEATMSAFKSTTPATPRRMPRLFAELLSLFGRLIPQLKKGAGFMSDELAYTGISLTEQQLRGIKVLCAIAAAFIAFIVMQEFHVVSLPILGVATVAGLLLPNLWLRARVRTRQRAIIRRLPEVIDLLSLCIGAGLDFLGSLNRVMAIRTLKQDPLIEELGITLQEIKLGKRRFEALKALARRVNIPELSSFVRTLVQADRMGTPIAEALAIHSEDMRFERYTRAERAALRAPIKILFPLILIMFCVAIVVGAPIFIQFSQGNLLGTLKP